jgi:hypothetical protein
MSWPLAGNGGDTPAAVPTRIRAMAWAPAPETTAAGGGGVSPPWRRTGLALGLGAGSPRARLHARRRWRARRRCGANAWPCCRQRPTGVQGRQRGVGAGVLTVGAGPAAAAAEGAEGRESPADFRERWEERTAIMVYDGRLPPTEGGEEMHTACLRRPLGRAPPGAPRAPRQPRRSGPQLGAARSGHASRHGLG